MKQIDEIEVEATAARPIHRGPCGPTEVAVNRRGRTIPL